MSTPTTLTKPTIAELVDLSGKTAIVTGGLASGLSSYLTGSQIVADGGMLLR